MRRQRSLLKLQRWRHFADGESSEHDVEEADVSRLQSLELVEQRGVSLGLTLRGVQKVARLRRS